MFPQQHYSISSPDAYAPVPQPTGERVVYAYHPNHRSTVQPTPIIKHPRHCDRNECHFEHQRPRPQSHVRFGANRTYREETQEERRARRAQEEYRAPRGHGNDYRYEILYDSHRRECDERRHSHERKRFAYADHQHRGRPYSQDSPHSRHVEHRSSSPTVGPSVLDIRDPGWKNPRPPAPPHSPGPMRPAVIYSQLDFPRGQLYASPQAYPARPSPRRHSTHAPDGTYSVLPAAPGFAIRPPTQPVATRQHAGSPEPRSVGSLTGYAATEYGGSDSE
ncbi:uncharacterized protein PHACADRAFT_208738 [Phanerochaete carnosa HHB-10118-sp]|uniref:Uncharacterized protein n=1 Tax=Phanerochaete carnosa (strain HHB-10118-sp) TaxID=650164 RepID=K5WXK8_PHACS|nr:uncharacterized protein PHACADRAFT_208738 [Phanerochaete carnosa HHB-10118-sp]EKM55222.1 hypothetical protein PHACADRAFT_208738 [Phanerochaete carnosa HHB-10118-sp]